MLILVFRNTLFANNLTDTRFIAVSMELLRDAGFKQVTNKRLTLVTTNIMTSSAVQCAAICLMDNSCLAIGVINTDDVMLCNLATNFSVVEEAGSDVYVRNRHSEGRNALFESLNMFKFSTFFTFKFKFTSKFMYLNSVPTFRVTNCKNK